METCLLNEEGGNLMGRRKRSRFAWEVIYDISSLFHSELESHVNGDIPSSSFAGSLPGPYCIYGGLRRF
jgi:hypothetical protein